MFLIIYMILDILLNLSKPQFCPLLKKETMTREPNSWGYWTTVRIRQVSISKYLALLHRNHLSVLAIYTDDCIFRKEQIALLILNNL